MQRSRTRLIAGSCGLGLLLAGLFVFLGQVLNAIDTGRLERVPVGSLLNDPMVRSLLPRFSEWSRGMPGSAEVGYVMDWLLNDVPLALFLAVIGGVTAWRTLLREPAPERKR
jgi:hypothetical protein